MIYTSAQKMHAAPFCLLRSSCSNLFVCSCSVERRSVLQQIQPMTEGLVLLSGSCGLDPSAIHSVDEDATSCRIVPNSES